MKVFAARIAVPLRKKSLLWSGTLIVLFCLICLTEFHLRLRLFNQMHAKFKAKDKYYKVLRLQHEGQRLLRFVHFEG